MNVTDLVSKINNKARDLNDCELENLIDKILEMSSNGTVSFFFGIDYIYFSPKNYTDIHVVKPNSRSARSNFFFKVFIGQELDKLDNEQLEKIWFDVL